MTINVPNIFDTGTRILAEPVNENFEFIQEEIASINAVLATNVAGLNPKTNVIVATTANIILAGTQTIDGVAVIANNRVLVKDQTNQAENGIYVVSAGTWARASDTDTWAEFVAAVVYVSQGTTNIGNQYACTVIAGGTLGSTAITWILYGSLGAFATTAALTAGLALKTNIADLAADTGAGLVGYKGSNTGEVSTTIKILADIELSLYRFGSPLVTTDWNLALNAALATGKQVKLPPGPLPFTGTLSCNVSNSGLIGDSRGTVLQPSDLTADIFQLGNLSTATTGLVFREFSIWPSVIKTAGWAWNCRLIQNSLWDRVYTGSNTLYVANSNVHRLWNGFYFDRFANIDIDGGETCVANRPAQHRGNLDQSFGAELTWGAGQRHKILHHSLPMLCGGGCGGIYLNNLDISEGAGGIRFDKSLTNVRNREGFILPASTLDTLSDTAVYVDVGGLETLDLKGWIAACGANSSASVIILDTTAVNASGLRLEDAPYDAMHFDGAFVVWVGGLNRSNGLGPNGGRAINALSGRLIMSGVGCHSNGSAARGDIVLDPAMTGFNIQGNMFFDTKTTKAITHGTLGTDKIIRNNTGYVTEANGQSTILNGTTSIVVNHGMATVPQYPMITQIAGTRTLAEVTTLTATQFTISIAAPASGDLIYQWVISAQ